MIQISTQNQSNTGKTALLQELSLKILEATLLDISQRSWQILVQFRLHRMPLTAMCGLKQDGESRQSSRGPSSMTQVEDTDDSTDKDEGGEEKDDMEE